MKKILLLFTTIILLCGCGKKDDELIMVTEAGFAPYEYYDNNEILEKCIEVKKLLVTSINTAKSKLNK